MGFFWKSSVEGNWLENFNSFLKNLVQILKIEIGGFDSNFNLINDTFEFCHTLCYLRNCSACVFKMNTAVD